MRYQECWPPLQPSVVPISKPETELISLDAMKDFLKAQNTTNDDRIKSLIISARVHAERHTKRSLVKKQYLMSLSRFPARVADRTDKLNLWYPPLCGGVSIVYIDADGAQQTLSSGEDFQVDFAGEPGRIAPMPGQCWPETLYGALNAVRVTYTAGYEPQSSLRLPADTDETDVTEPEVETVDHPSDSQASTLTVDRTVPNDLVNAVMQLVAHWNQNRMPVVTTAGAGGDHVVLPWHLEKILDDYTFDTLTPTVTPEF